MYKRQLQRYRSIGALPYKTLGKKTYYSEEDVLTFLFPDSEAEKPKEEVVDLSPRAYHRRCV